ncbi:MAG: protein adenylyltransferase SelO family protein, partial [Flavobacterium sp.]|nr:protein adenylyltransferase SelO family protein [Flavobacterium sp.]
WTPNTTDRENRRYRFGNQPQIALWNLYQLANAMYPLIDEAAPLEAILQSYQDKYEVDYNTMMNEKLGLTSTENNNEDLIGLLSQNLLLHETDMTILFRNLGKIAQTDSEEMAFEKISESFYNLEKISTETKEIWLYWFTQYLLKVREDNVSDIERANKMNKVNPKYVLRNYMAQLAIDSAEKGDYSLLYELYELLKNPYDDQLSSEKWFAKRPDWARQKIGSSMLSCSS